MIQICELRICIISCCLGSGIRLTGASAAQARPRRRYPDRRRPRGACHASLARQSVAAALAAPLLPSLLARTPCASVEAAPLLRLPAICENPYTLACAAYWPAGPPNGRWPAAAAHTAQRNHQAATSESKPAVAFDLLFAAPRACCGPHGSRFGCSC
ncbi:MAG: hypothetical protein J3K34DRAFT_417157 [Monoraphidium minutum]|nr:MAG: hypothetical protein J3K34DRAFT_417157 [Monoraphidium minutum]